MKILASKTILQTLPFAVQELDVTFNDQRPSEPYYRLAACDWVNILPVVCDGRALLIRQPRVGSGKLVLEVPGGMLDEGEHADPMMAAVRELEEETGFTSQRILPLATLNPNPALMTNRMHFFLALDCHPNAQRRHFPGKEEMIESILVPTTELDSMVRTSQIDHALSALCIMLAGKYVKTC